jgi:hypothetical protein
MQQLMVLAYFGVGPLAVVAVVASLLRAARDKER